jgi:hypothetical protein
MRAIWSGTVKSENRKDKTTGRPLEYRLAIFDTGEGTCSCPSFLYQSMNNPEISAEDKLRYRCKHLREAFAVHGPEAEAPTAAPPPPAPEVEATATPAPNPYGLWLDDDEPRTRRES